METTIPPVRTCSIEGCGKAQFCRGWCAAHYSRWQRHGDPLHAKRHSPQPPDAAQRWCPKCKTYVASELFGIRQNGRPGGYCKACVATYEIEYRSTEAGARSRRRAKRRWIEDNREYFLMRNYGIGLAEYEAMWDAQDAKCAICGTENAGTRTDWLVVDHCHDSNVVRGLLCVHCNLAIGQMADDPARLRAAADYLDRFK